MRLRVNHREFRLDMCTTLRIHPLEVSRSVPEIGRVLSRIQTERPRIVTAEGDLTTRGAMCGQNSLRHEIAMLSQCQAYPSGFPSLSGV